MLDALKFIIFITVMLYFLSNVHSRVLSPAARLTRFDISRIDDLEGVEDIRNELLYAESILRSIRQDVKFCVPLQRNPIKGEILVPDAGAYSDDDRKAFGDVRITRAVPVYMENYMLNRINTANDSVKRMFAAMSMRYNIEHSEQQSKNQYKVIQNIISTEVNVQSEFSQLKMDVVIACSEQKERLKQIDPSLARYTLRNSNTYSNTKIPKYEFGKTKVMIRKHLDTKISLHDRQLMPSSLKPSPGIEPGAGD